MSILTDIGETIWPRRGDEHGPLSPILLALTVVTGVVDAASYIKLGHVFVANMTGNVVFIGFALGGVKGLSATRSLAALAAFLLGALTGGQTAARIGSHRGRLLRGALILEAALVAAALLIALVVRSPVSRAAQYGLIALLGLAMGIQNSSARRLGVPDLTTTVLTLTLTGAAADSRAAGGPGSKLGRRLLPVTAMFAGALVGGLLAVHVSVAAPIGTAAGLLAGAAAAAHLLAGSTAAWTEAAK